MRHLFSRSNRANGQKKTNPRKELGLKLITGGVDPVVDIVAIHGLDGHRDRTWTAANGKNWLSDFLPQDIPNARIWSWGYDANTHSHIEVSHSTIWGYGESLVGALSNEREMSKTSRLPIIFIAHSLGGIVVKSALIYSNGTTSDHLPEHRWIKACTYGVMFMGTPHQGGNGVKAGTFVLNMASVFMPTNKTISKKLERDSEWLEQLNEQYLPISKSFVTHFAYEEYETKIFTGARIMIVPRYSAALPGTMNAEKILIHADHCEMVRYESERDDGYRAVGSRIQRMTEKAGELDSQWAESRLQNIKPDEPFAVNFGIPGVYESECFVGRDREIAEIEKYLKYSDDRRTGVIYGIGGMGKTQLALKYANLHRGDYSAVFWFNSRDEDTLKQSFLSNAERIKDSPLFKNRWACVEKKGPDEAVTALGEWLSMTRNKRWLLCFDNYDDINSYDIRKYFPVAKQGAILVTTRSHGILWGHCVPVEKFAQVSTCLLVLSHTSGRENLEESKLIKPIISPSLLTRLDPDARKLAERLDGLPLALTTAGCYLRLSPASFSDYLRRYQDSWSRLLEMSPRLSSYDHTLRTTWDLSLRQVRKQNHLAEKILQFWAYFDNQDIWFQLLQKGQAEGPAWLLEVTKDEMQFEWMMQALCDHGLVTKAPYKPFANPEVGGYSMHSCVHDWTIHALDDPLNGKKWHSETLKLALFCLRQHLPTNGYAKYWTPHPRLVKHTTRCQRILDDIEVCAENDDKKPLIKCMQFLGNLYRDQGKLDRAEKMFRRALGRLGTPDTDAESKAMLQHNLGAIISQQGRNVEAEKLLKEALYLKREILGPRHTSTLRSVSALALLYKAQRNFLEAEKLYSGALKYERGESGDSDISSLQKTFHVAHLHFEQGELVEAEHMFLEVLNGYKKSLDDDHPLILGVYTALARLHLKQQRLVETEEMYKMALQGYTTHFDQHHESTLRICVELGQFYRKHARLIEAEQRFKQAEEGYLKNIGPDSQLRKTSLTVLASVAGLASLYNYQAKLPEAEHYSLQALAGYRDALGEDHKLTLEAARDLGHVYWRQKNWVAAERQYHRVLEAYQRTSGPEGLLTLGAAVSLGQIYHFQDKLDEAEQMFKQAEKGYARNPGPNSEPRTIALCSLMEIHRKQRRSMMIEAKETEEQSTKSICGRNEDESPALSCC